METNIRLSLVNGGTEKADAKVGKQKPIFDKT